MAENFEKLYYKKLKKSFDDISKDNEFYHEISNAIMGGKRDIYQKRIKETQVFDATWVETFEKYLKYVDKIVRMPKQVMQANQEVVRIERAKKINAASVAHLSSHTENVQTITDEGIVIPKKILSTVYEDNIAIYENRFVVALISKMAAFVEIRYNAIQESKVSYQSDRLNVNSAFKWRNYEISAKIDLQVKENIDTEENRKNKELMKRIETLRMYIRGFVNTEFFKTVKQAAPVSAPILRTNIILKNVDYNACLQLWQFMDSYRQLGFEVDQYEKNLEFDKNYEQEVVDMIIRNYSCVVSNQEDRSEQYLLAPFKFKNLKAPRIVNKLEVEGLQAGEKEMEQASANEYFYQKTLSELNDEYEEQLNQGKTYKQSLVSLYKKLQSITNSVYKELLNNLEEQVPSDASFKERKRAKYATLKKKASVLNSILWLRENDVEATKRELEKINKNLEKLQQYEDWYQEDLKRQRREALAKARAARKLLPKSEADIAKEEEEKRVKLENMAHGRDKARFEKEKAEEEARILEEARLKELAEEKAKYEAELALKLEEERKEAIARIHKERAEKISNAPMTKKVSLRSIRKAKAYRTPTIATRPIEEKESVFQLNKISGFGPARQKELEEDIKALQNATSNKQVDAIMAKYAKIFARMEKEAKKDDVVEESTKEEAIVVEQENVSTTIEEPKTYSKKELKEMKKQEKIANKLAIKEAKRLAKEEKKNKKK